MLQNWIPFTQAQTQAELQRPTQHVPAAIERSKLWGQSRPIPRKSSQHKAPHIFGAYSTKHFTPQICSLMQMQPLGSFSLHLLLSLQDLMMLHGQPFAIQGPFVRISEGFPPFSSVLVWLNKISSSRRWREVCLELATYPVTL